MSPSWKYHLGVLVFALLAVAGAWFETIVHMARILWTVDVFAHGLVTPLVSGALIWSRRRELALVNPNLHWFGLLVTFGSCFVWLGGELLDIRLFQHIALVTIVQGLTIGLLGMSVYRTMLFPMLFLYFSVPFGSELVGPLQFITANMVVGTLDIIGADYTAEGMLITLPSGLYEVAEACAGVKFLFTSVFTGVLLAHLLYSNWKKQLAVVIGSTVLPIVANVLRVLLILLIAELSDQKLAKGFDHLVYGWVFLSIVLFALISVAYRFVEDKPPLDVRGANFAEPQAVGAKKIFFAFTILSVAGPLLASTFAVSTPHDGQLTEPIESSGITLGNQTDFRVLPDTDLIVRPVYLSADRHASYLFRHNGVVFRAYIAVFNHLRSGKRMFQPGNSLAPAEWKEIERRNQFAELKGCLVPVTEITLQRGESRVLLWTQSRLGSSFISNGIEEKLYTALARVKNEAANASVFVLSAPLLENSVQLRASFEEFLSTIRLDHDLNGAGGVNVRNGGLCAE